MKLQYNFFAVCGLVVHNNNIRSMGYSVDYGNERHKRRTEEKMLRDETRERMLGTMQKQSSPSAVSLPLSHDPDSEATMWRLSARRPTDARTCHHSRFSGRRLNGLLRSPPLLSFLLIDDVGEREEIRALHKETEVRSPKFLTAV